MCCMSGISGVQTRIVTAVLILCMMITGCFFGTEQVQAASKIGLNRTYVVTTIGGTVQLSLNGTSKKAVWSSSDTKRAKVSKNGKVTAVKDGVVTITATMNKKKYNSVIYIGDYWVDNMSFDDYRSNLINMEKGNSCYVDFAFHAGTEYPNVPQEDVKVSVEKENIIGLEYLTKVEDGTTFLYKVRITGVNDGKTDLSFTIGKLKKTMKVTIGTGTGKLDPADAVKQRNYIGYSEAEAATLKKAAEIIDQNDLNSSTMSVEEKIRLIQHYFTVSRNCNPDGEKEGEIANILFYGHGKASTEERDYAATLGFFCECLDIPYKFCRGGAFYQGDNGLFINLWNAVESNGKWYYVDTYLNSFCKTTDYLCSEQLWEDHDLWEEGEFRDYFSDGNSNIRYHLLLSSNEYKKTVIWDVE